MKKTILITLLFSVVLSASSQIAVESFNLLETDLTAITAGTQETDQNGEVAALIKVVTTQKGFTFDNGMLGIVKVVQQPAEIWVYVPQKTQKISISHPDIGMLRNYYFQIPIEKGRTYELKLTTSRVKTIIEEDAGGGFLALKVEPSSANVYVDDQPQALNDEGMLSLFLLYGEHTYRVEALGYKTETGRVNITSDETQKVTVALTSTMARLTLSSSMPDVEIWVNNELKGKGQWTGGLAAGTYIVESRKTGHRSRRTTLTLSENEERTMELPEPEPIIGRLRTESNPLEAEVWLEGKKLGTTPGIFGDILAGKHEIRFTKEGYVSQTVEVTVEEGKIASASVTLQKNAATLSRDKVAEDAAKRNEQQHGDYNGHAYVDLGLSVKWATCNVGASSPEDYGDYFAWGETTTKSNYSWKTLKYRTSGFSSNNVKFSKYVTDSKYGTVDNKTLLELEDDAAHVNWGGSWRMPTDDEFDELLNNCTWTWTSQGGHNGYKVVSKSNGNSIFLPSAGYRDGTSLNGAGSNGYYWSSSLNTSYPYYAWNLGFYSGFHGMNYYSRRYGQSVRPVCP